MLSGTDSSPVRSSWRAFALPALLIFAAQSPANAQVIGIAGGCETSRAEESIDRVEAAMLSWLTDVTSGFAVAPTLGGSSCIGSGPVDIALVPVIPVADLRALLVPVYISSIPENDPWEMPYDYRLNVANPLSQYAVALRSAGSDNLFESTTYSVGTTSGPQGDLVRYNGTRVRQPPRLDPVSRQLVTVAQVQNLGTAMLSWLTDVISGAHRAPEGGPTVNLSLITPTSASDLAAFLSPFYIQCVPEQDGWGNPLDLRLNDDLLGSPVMSIRSPGSDGLVEGDVYDTETFPADNLDRDIVWSDGQFFRRPAENRTTIFIDDFESATLWGTWSCGPGF